MPRFYNQQEFDAALRPIASSIFSGREIVDCAFDDLSQIFIHRDWPMVGLGRSVQKSEVARPTTFPEDEVEAMHIEAWVAFYETLRAIGEEELVIAVPPGGYPRSCPDEWCRICG
jgi:hypothetical protein